MFKTPEAKYKRNTLTLIAVSTKCCPFPSPRNISLPENIFHLTTYSWPVSVVCGCPCPNYIYYQWHEILLPLSGLSMHSKSFTGIHLILEWAVASTISTFPSWLRWDTPPPLLPYPPIPPIPDINRHSRIIPFGISEPTPSKLSTFLSSDIIKSAPLLFLYKLLPNPYWTPPVSFLLL